MRSNECWIVSWGYLLTGIRRSLGWSHPGTARSCCEGIPGSTKEGESNEEGSIGSIFNDRDIFIRDLTLTPDTFDDSLHGSRLEQSRS